MKPWLKRHLLPGRRALWRIRGGIAAGMWMHLDLRSQLQRWLGLDERELASRTRRLIETCSNLVDIGANDGYYTLAFLRSCAVKVVACEPSAASELLLENAKANGFSLGDRFCLERRLVGHDATAVSVRDLVRDFEGDTFLKVDVDGGEHEVLRSAEGSEHLGELHWIVETHSVALEKLCLDWFSTHGFRVEIIDHAWWRIFLPEQRPLEQNRWLVAEPKLVATP